MSNLTNFPYLNASEFSFAISSLCRLFHQVQSLSSSPRLAWTSVEIILDSGAPHLRITKPLHIRTLSSSTSSIDIEAEDEKPQQYSGQDKDDVTVSEEDDDLEALPKHNKDLDAMVIYDIILSSTYSVPVFYFAIKDIAYRYPPTMRVLYECIIPPRYVEQTEAVGVLGGVTVTDHPTANTPVYFLHPCKTVEVLRASTSSSSDGESDPLSYLLLWISTMGKSIGVDVPLALMLAMRKEKQESNQRT
ncbi:unnamed protein product [Periconia digitata]|uniref:Ubiquitin-like-conjugating enzyme ATG10 n=1 Tax=Periconia digitata TaxID=1303443 RepID=A0A9W4URI4_9PLEO|nr:unnamed protein product [Periconia digitata]